MFEALCGLYFFVSNTQPLVRAPMCLRQVAAGAANKIVASQLGISEETC
jgi:hypothetical protein